jgi:crotonobetainyl-CoA:carnitine CoA-transferase CaiB-like acyl-CoA transferase
VNLRTDEGKDIIYRLLPKVDVIVQNFRPGVMKRLGLDYEAVSQINSRIIYCSISGYGESGPWVERPGQDLLAQAMSGVMYMNGPADSPPLPGGNSMADHGTGKSAAYSIVTALLARERFGIGQEVNVDLFTTMIDLQAEQLFYHMNTNRPPKRSSLAGHGGPSQAGPYGVYQTLDSKWIAISGDMDTVCNVLGLPEYSKDPRFATWEGRIDNRELLRTEVQKKIANWNRDELLRALWEAGGWCAPVNDYEALLEEPQVAENEMILELEHPVAGKYRAVGIPYKLVKTPGRIKRSPPLLGQHTGEVLEELGYTDECIKRLSESGAIYCGSTIEP